MTAVDYSGAKRYSATHAHVRTYVRTRERMPAVSVPFGARRQAFNIPFQYPFSNVRFTCKPHGTELNMQCFLPGTVPNQLIIGG